MNNHIRFDGQFIDGIPKQSETLWRGKELTVVLAVLCVRLNMNRKEDRETGSWRFILTV